MMFALIRDRLSLCHGAMLNVPPPAFIHAAADAGFTSVSLRVRNPSKEAPGKILKAWTIEGESELRRQTRQALTDRGVRVSEAEASILVPGCDLRELEPYMESAAVVGASGVIALFVGQNDETEIVDQLGEFAKKADQYGLKALVEFIPVLAVSNLRLAERVVRASGAANARIIVDSLHLARSGGTPAEVATIDPALIAMVQLSDGPADFPRDGENWWIEMSTDRRFLGRGDFPLHELIEALPEDLTIGYEVISREFQERGLPPAEMARIAMDDIRACFGG